MLLNSWASCMYVLSNYLSCPSNTKRKNIHFLIEKVCRSIINLLLKFYICSFLKKKKNLKSTQDFKLIKNNKARKNFSFLVGIFCLQTGKLPEKGNDSSKDTRQANGRA